MKSILGFGIGEKPETESIICTTLESQLPVRSLVSVRFIRDGRTLTYYNDKFALEVGDHVFVSGKLAGQLGIVEKVSTKFKINLADYQKVIAKANTAIHGTYESVLDKMVSYDHDAMTPDEFRAWILPPAHWEDDADDEDEEVIVGDGYELSLESLERCDEASPVILERAADYCRNGKVAYISVCHGVGTAFVEGSSWYEVNFSLNGDSMTEMYCNCPYPGLCKHLLAVALTIRAMVKIGKLDADRDFIAIDDSRFWNMVARSTKRITL